MNPWTSFDKEEEAEYFCYIKNRTTGYTWTYEKQEISKLNPEWIDYYLVWRV